MNKYFNLAILTIAIIWGGVKKDIFKSIWVNLIVSTVVLIVLWMLMEIGETK